MCQGGCTIANDTPRLIVFNCVDNAACAVAAPASMQQSIRDPVPGGEQRILCIWRYMKYSVIHIKAAKGWPDQAAA